VASILKKKSLILRNITPGSIVPGGLKLMPFYSSGICQLNRRFEFRWSHSPSALLRG